MDVKCAIDEASMFDIMMVSKLRATRITHLYSSKEGSSLYGTDPMLSQRYSRGNVAVLPQDTASVQDMLPPDRSEIHEAMCTLFVGSRESLPSRVSNGLAQCWYPSNGSPH